MFSVQTICNLYILLRRRIVVVGKKKIARSNWEPDQFASSQKVRTNSLEE